jgi:outer membrane protein assembly factor BamB
VKRREFIQTSAALALAGVRTPASAEEQPLAAQSKIPPITKTSWASFRNGNQLHGIAQSSLPKKLKLKWKVAVKDGVTATAAIVGDHVYCGTFGGELICFERETGKRVWTYFSEERKKPKDFIPGFQASPTVSKDLVLLGSEYGVFHAVDRATGKIRWKVETEADIMASAAVVGDRVIFGSYDFNLYCVNIADGTEVWKFETQERINGSPAIAGDITFVTGCDQHLRAINIKTGKEEFDMNLEHFLISSPAVTKDMLYVGTHESDFLAIDLNKQEVKWRYKHETRELPIHSSAAVLEDRILFGGQDKQLHCLYRDSGKEEWSFSARGQINSSPVVVDRSRVFVGSNDGNLYEVGLKDGKQRWKTKLGRAISASPAVGEGCLVIGAEGREGEIYCFG